MGIKKILDEYMEKVPEVVDFSDRCLRSERWNKNVVLMVFDAALTSIGVNYFNAVVPKVRLFKEVFIDSGKINGLKDLANINLDDLKVIWKNERSLRVAKDVAHALSSFGNDVKALRVWAENSRLENWKSDVVGKIKGVGINTYQYLRMMGGVDTVMPDKIVKRVVNEILRKAGEREIFEDIKFIKKVHEIAEKTGYRAIDICFMSWLVQYDDEKRKKYSKMLSEI